MKNNLPTKTIPINTCFKNSANQSGATMVEFALAFPLFFIIVMAIIDIGLYMTYWGLANAAANRALTQAQINPWVDAGNCAALGASAADCENGRRDSLKRALDDAKNFASAVSFGTNRNTDRRVAALVGEGANDGAAFEILLPPDANQGVRAARYQTATSPDPSYSFNTNDPGLPSLKELLQNEPITVYVRAEYRPFLTMIGSFGFGRVTIPILGRAMGYREPSVSQVYPMNPNCVEVLPPLNQPPIEFCGCPGNPDQILVAGGPACACPPGMTQDPATGKCVCPPGAQKDSSGYLCLCDLHAVREYCMSQDPPLPFARDCTCAAPCTENRGLNQTGDACECVNVCPDGQGHNGSDCACIPCPEGSVSENNSCKCVATIIGGTYIVDPATGCQANCPPGLQEVTWGGQIYCGPAACANDNPQCFPSDRGGEGLICNEGAC